MLCCKITPPGFNDLDALELKNKIKEKFQSIKINIVQIGANDGISADPIYDLIKDNENIKAFLVEPQHDAFEQLVNNYTPYNISNRIKFLKYAITDKNESIKLYKNNAVNGTDGHSSLILRDLDIHEGNIVADFREDSYELVDGINVKTFLSLIDYINIDILVIDTEGYDLEIVKMFISNRIFPSILFFESPGITGKIPGKNFIDLTHSNNFINNILSIFYDIKSLSSNYLCILKEI